MEPGPTGRLWHRRWRRGGAMVAAAAAAAVLAACGSGPEAPSGAAPSGNAFPVTIEHQLGVTTIESEPQRVVTLGYTDQDAVLAVGVAPVATTEWYGERPGALFPWASEKLGDNPLPSVLPTANPVPFEQIAAQSPDLILSVYGGLTQPDYDRLSQIAPTVAQPAGVQNYQVPWDQQTQIIGQALGRSAQAEEAVRDVREKIDAVRAAHPEFAGKSAVNATWLNNQWYVYASRDQRGRLLTDLGFTIPPAIDQLAGDRFGAPLSFERGDLLDVDLQVWLPAQAADEQAIRSSPGFATSAAATQGRALFVPIDAGTDMDPMGGNITVLSLPRLLDVLGPQLSAAADGNPATAPPALAPSAS